MINLNFKDVKYLLEEELKEKGKLGVSTRNIKFLNKNIKRVTIFLDKHYKNVTLIQRFYCILNNINNIDKIKKCYCGKPVVLKRRNGFGISCGNKVCTFSNLELKKKIEETNIKKYGYKNPMQNKEVKERLINKIKEKYGIDNVSKLDFIKKKKIDTCLKNFGVEHPMTSKEVQEKSKLTLLNKYGIINIGQHPNHIKEMKNGLSAYANTFVRKSSKIQLILFYMVQEIFPSAIFNYPVYSLNYNIDIVCPSLSLAIEFDGSYWHNMKKDYDIKRQKELEDEGWKFIRYINNLPTKESLLKDILNNI